MSEEERTHDRWARLRFAIIGPLLAAPPPSGELRAEIERLSAKPWRHPTTGEPVRFGCSTIERWYYAARNEGRDPVGILKRRMRKDSGTHPSVSSRIQATLRTQWQAHKGWSVQLHLDNLAVLVERDADLGRLPSYSTVRRYMKTNGLTRTRRRRGPRGWPEKAEERFERREVRSYEAAYVHGLWHSDFHHGSLKVLTQGGEWETPLLMAVVDDRSRLCCHAQWYLAETTESFVHGLSQAIQKRALPRALLTDNGSPMIAAETVQGLGRLSVVAETTLPASPYQNAKQEVFWAQVEGRLMAMLEGVSAELTLAFLNEATQAWVELEYNREPHSETGEPPIERYLRGPEVGRESPSSEKLRAAFTMEETRTQRRSDGTVIVEGIRFEIPGRFHHIERIPIRYARWDLSYVLMVDAASGTVLGRLWPLDKERNSDGIRRAIEPGTPGPAASGIAPLLEKLMGQYRSSGLPPAYLPKDDCEEDPPMSKKLLQLYGLKWNPFAPEIPTEALFHTSKLDSFVWRLEHLAREGGFAAAFGEPGTGKSVALRLVADRLGALRDVVVGVLTRPQAHLGDFYRELGHLFGVSLQPHNRWAGAKALRDTWFAHIDSSPFRPVLLVDEAQEARTDVLSELRLLASADLDARSILTVVFAGDRRFQEKLRLPELLPLESRLRVKLVIEAASRDELNECLHHGLEKAGNPKLMTPELQATLVEHAGGNYRALMTLANDLLLAGAQREARILDEKLFFDVFAAPAVEKPRPQASGRAR